MRFDTHYSHIGRFVLVKKKMTILVNRGRFDIQISEFMKKLRLIPCKYLHVHSSKFSTCPTLQGITLCKRVRTQLTGVCNISGWILEISWLMTFLNSVNEDEYRAILKTLRNPIAKTLRVYCPVSKGVQ